jgi:uncharacterized protein (AIM24 family)
MRSDLFGAHVEVGDGDGDRMSLQNSRLVKVVLDGEVLARQGAMVAYQGEIEFVFEGAGGMKNPFKKALTGEGVPLMRCRGQGDLFLARNSDQLHLTDLDGGSQTVNGANVLALEPRADMGHPQGRGRDRAVGRRVQHGLHRDGMDRVVGLRDASLAPTYADLQSAIAWSSSLRTRLVRTAKAGALIGRGSGEALQIAFEGDGVVVVQASEGPVVPKHDHKGVSDWLS